MPSLTGHGLRTAHRPAPAAGAAYSRAAPGEAGGVLRLVVLQHHPGRAARQRLGARGSASRACRRRCRPSRPRPRLSPAGAMSLTWTRAQPVAVPVEPGQPGRRRRAPARRGPPRTSAAILGTRVEQQLERRATVGERLQLPVMVVVAEREPARRPSARAMPPSSAPTARQPAASVGRSRSSSGTAGMNSCSMPTSWPARPPSPGASRRSARPTWPRRGREAARVEHGPGGAGVGQMAADGLDAAGSPASASGVELAGRGRRNCAASRAGSKDRAAIVHAGLSLTGRGEAPVRAGRRPRWRTGRCGWGRRPRVRRSPGSR